MSYSVYPGQCVCFFTPSIRYFFYFLTTCLYIKIHTEKGKNHDADLSLLFLYPFYFYDEQEYDWRNLIKIEQAHPCRCACSFRNMSRPVRLTGRSAFQQRVISFFLVHLYLQVPRLCIGLRGCHPWRACGRC